MNLTMTELMGILFNVIAEAQKAALDKQITVGEFVDILKVTVDEAGMKDHKLIGL